MKFTFKDSENMPPGPHRTIVVEPTEGRFWCHDEDCRSAGKPDNGSFASVLKWILRQIALGHVAPEVDERGDVVSLHIGKTAAFNVETAEQASEAAGKADLQVDIAGRIAEAREKGTSQQTYQFECRAWAQATPAAHFRQELHYALEFTELLGRTSKKVKKLDLLPILESAPENTRQLLAEATRCHLFKLDNACIALCRACVEDALNGALTPSMRDEWRQQVSLQKGPMEALIDVCASHGVIGVHKRDAHKVRQAGNEVLHAKVTDSTGGNTNVAADVLRITRILIDTIHGKHGDHA